MKYARAIVRLIALSIVTAAFYSLRLVGGSLTFSARSAEWWRNWLLRSWARCVLFLLNVRVDVFNAAPQAPFLLVANHLSYFDVVLLASQMDCAFVAKREVAGWPVLGHLCRSMDTVFIDRRRKRDIRRALLEMQKLFERGSSVVLFAEGTSTAGQTVSPFKSSMLDFAVRNNVPVYYASISYATNVLEPAASEAVCWWGEMTFPDHFFGLLQLSGFNASLTFGPEPIVAGDRRELAVKLWAAVRGQFVPVPS